MTQLFSIFFLSALICNVFYFLCLVIFCFGAIFLSSSLYGLIKYLAFPIVLFCKCRRNSFWRAWLYSIRFQLAQLSDQISETYYLHHRSHATTKQLHWIRSSSLQFSRIWKGKKQILDCFEKVYYYYFFISYRSAKLGVPTTLSSEIYQNADYSAA